MDNMSEGILNKIMDAGVVGAGGAGFPTGHKIKPGPEFVVINGAECEPLLKVDQQLTEKYAQRLIKTLNILVNELGAKAGIFSLKKKYQGAILALEKEIKPYKNLYIKTLENIYPMGDEQVLVYESLGRIVPEGGIPLATGVVVFNVETLLNIEKSLNGTPVIEKYVSVVGAVKNPKTLLVPVGVSYASLLEMAGGALVNNPVVIDGGPMMGRVNNDLNTPVSKTTKGLIVLDQSHPRIINKNQTIESMMRTARIACCHCMLCTDLCPRYLLGHKLRPDKLMRLASYNSTCEKEAAATEAFLCCECGLCEIACIMNLQPWKLNKALKGRLSALGIKNPHHQTPAQVNPFRSTRQYPVPRLIRRLGLSAYEHQEAPLLEEGPPGQTVKILLKQSLGAPSQPLVQIGDKINRGDPVASPPEGALGAQHHASISGEVLEINQSHITIGGKGK
jgi:Na+-translocating ferredoxin:NAD+ oxidoreductase RnfC subunit